MRAKLAAAHSHAEKTRGIFRCCGGRAFLDWQPNGHVACRISDVAAVAPNVFRATKRLYPIRSLPHRIASARCEALEENPRGLFERTPAASPERLDAYWPEGDFTPAELALARRHECQPITLGPIILRV